MAKGSPVRGDVQPATPDGFARLIAKANEVHADGLVLVGVVNVGPRTLGAVYVRMPERPQSNLIGE